MIVPNHWAESRRRHRERGRQITVRRWGWSDASVEDAQAMADRRADEALARLRAGDALPRRERRVPYNGADGLPIREEVLARDGDCVITRNAYGARCLNTPDVLFADIDFDAPIPRSAWLAALVTGAAAGLVLVQGAHATGPAWLTLVGAAVIAVLLTPALRTGLRRLAGGPEALARRRIRRFVAAHPDWHLRLYRTPAGLRLLAMHALFDPQSEAVGAFFDAVGSDPVYARMCRRQRCFRARLTPKPWRVGLREHLKPRPGVWPVGPQYLPERADWVARYETATRGHAACRYLEALGAAGTHPKAAAVGALHDAHSGALTGRPIA